MSLSCIHCSALTVWDDVVGSAVCISCGALTDPSQSVLTNTLESTDSDSNNFWLPTHSTTLKSLRSTTNWDLPGQTKESRDRKNGFAIADFIKSLAVSLSASGLSPRAITLFNQAKAASNFRWGKKSRSVAAVCLSIALREANRPDSLRDIASISNSPYTSLTREFFAVTSSLNLSPSLTDPSVHFNALHDHLTSALRDNHLPRLPASLVSSLHSISLHSANQTAVALSRLLPRLAPHHEILRLPAAPTACAIFILALEAEIRAALNSLADIAHCLATRCQSTKSLVMSRYKTIQDEIADWIEQIPWLDKYEKNARPKVAKRTIVARGTKDVINFQEEIWQKKPKPELNLLEDNNDEPISADIRPTKRRKLNKTMTKAAQFLLDPLGSSCVASSSSHSSTSNPLSAALYMLTAPSALTSYARPPTRLQLLALDRGGTTEDQIPDEDLFEPGELENLLRSEEEMAILREHFSSMADQDPQSDSGLPDPAAKSTRRRTNNAARDNVNSSPTRKGTRRINMDALARFYQVVETDGTPDEDVTAALAGLQGMDLTAEVDDDDQHLEDEISSPEHSPPRKQPRAALDEHPTFAQDDEIIFDDWRPPSPDGDAGAFESRYEEEYD